MEQKRRTNVFVGSAIERIEDLRLLRGRGQFVDDLARDDLLHAVILRSSVAHARIRSIDPPPPPPRPAVPAVTTGGGCAPASRTTPCRQVPPPPLGPSEQPATAPNKVRYGGEPIAIVLPETAAAAEDALDAISVDIDPLPAVVATAGAL